MLAAAQGASHYKRPCTPVFVVQSESHYSVLWAHGGTPPDLPWAPSDRLAGDPDPAEAEEEAADEEPPPPQLADGAEPEHVAPLEAVIKTRWPAALIDWNGEEIIL